MTRRYDSVPTLTWEIPSSGGFPFSPICARMRRAFRRSRSSGGLGGLFMRSLRNQAERREECAGAAVALEPDRARARKARAGRDPEIDALPVDDEPLRARELREVPRELRARHGELIAHLDERDALARARRV